MSEHRIFRLKPAVRLERRGQHGQNKTDQRDHRANLADSSARSRWGFQYTHLVARVNYLGLRHLTLGIVDRLSSGGAIVNFSSILGAEWPARLDLHKQLAGIEGFGQGLKLLEAHPVPQETCYQYFKEALIVWTSVAAQKLFMQHGIRMNSVAPGPVFTPILGDFITMLGQERVDADAHRMKRPGFADEIAPPVLFLCSDGARWITGINLPIDGGLVSTYV
jgi:NAD(P)-dependent dehydrogenase (short-subunit alcohol dehydrogenase family)